MDIAHASLLSRPRRRACRSALLAVALALGAAPAAAQETLYKWIDERGMVNYGDAPPAGAKMVRQLDQSKVTLSVVPGLGKETLDDLHEREMRTRIEQLERQLQELRERESQKTAAPAEAEPPRVTALGDYVVQPLMLMHRPPPHPIRFPVRGRPVHKTAPFAGMQLEKRPHGSAE